jgi:hypothetical protein
MSYDDVRNEDAFGSRRVEHPPSRFAEYDVDARRRLVTVKFGKKMTVGDIERYARLLRSNPSFQPDYSETVDLTQVEELDLQADEFLRLADEIDPFAPQAKRAFAVRTSTQKHGHAQGSADTEKY